ncbi:MAG TPA: hypothetical protein V6C57_01145, partial [Coleofasciculaceae cyanobacterium]
MAFQVAIAEFNRVDFVDRFGTTRIIAGCSLCGREEFFARIRELCDRMNSEAGADETWEQFYERDDRTKFLVKRCLELNGIDPDWVNLSMIDQLLLSRPGELEGMPKQGWLVELNLPRKPAQEGQAAASLEQMIAALSSHTQGLIEALELARDPKYPANELVEILEARVEQQKEALPDKKKPTRADFEKQRKKLQERLSKVNEGDAIAPV